MTAVVYIRRSKPKLAHLPPGPPGLPILGNIFQINALRPYPKMREWALQYGPIFHLRIGPQDVIVVNTAEAADELFITRSSQYSGRVSPHVAHDIMSDGQRLGFLPYGKEWKTRVTRRHWAYSIQDSQAYTGARVACPHV